jgi:hypothetical protein
MFEPAYHRFLLIVVPIVLLALFLQSFREKKYPDILIVSVLLVVCDLPHLLTIPALLSGSDFAGTASVPFLAFLLLLGAGCISLGCWGIVYSRNALTQEARR